MERSEQLRGMSVTLFTLLVDDPVGVFEWLALHGGEHVIRKQARETVGGWFVKVALDDKELSGRFKSQWADSFATLENHRSRLARGRARERP